MEEDGVFTFDLESVSSLLDSSVLVGDQPEYHPFITTVIVCGITENGAEVETEQVWQYDLEHPKPIFKQPVNLGLLQIVSCLYHMPQHCHHFIDSTVLLIFTLLIKPSFHRIGNC